MKLKIYQVDAFTDEVFKGNPAAVCPLEEWLPEEILQKIAAENNLAETAFYVPKEDDFEIRWFTPTVEVALCGHATLASAYVLYHLEGFKGKLINFQTVHSGKLSVEIKENQFLLNFPADHYSETEITEDLLNATDKTPKAAFKGKTDFMLVFDNEEDITSIRPNLEVISKLDARGLIVTAKGTNSDFVSRFFAPGVGVNEDPVCGSAHTTLTPYWAKTLEKTELTAFQYSSRSGKLNCRLLNDRVELGGNAVLYMEGYISI